MGDRNERNIELIKAKDYDTLIKENINLVRHIINRMHVPSVDYDDYFQIGCLGLYTAAQYFNIDSDAKFSTFAAIAIHRKVAQAFGRNLEKQNSLDIVSLDVYADNADNEVDILLLYDDGKRIDTNILTTELYEKIYTVMNNNNLTEAQRDIFTMVAIDGKSQTEAADILGISRQYISFVYNAALKKIRKELEKADIDSTYLSN